MTRLALDGFRIVTTGNPETHSLRHSCKARGGRQRVGLTAGVRWTTEAPRHHAQQFGRALPPGSAAAIAARERLGGFVSTDVATEEDFTSGMLSARFAFSEGMMAYVSLARGAKSGGINVAIVPAGIGQTLEPETANNVEVGWKSQWLDDVLQLNLAAF